MRPTTLIDLLEKHAADRGGKIAFRQLLEGRPGGAVEEMSYRTLAVRARTLARALRDAGYHRRTVLLLYPSSHEFVAAFLGCLYGGIVAVPAYPPDPHRLNRTLPRLQAIVRDARARAILTVGEVRSLAREIATAAPGLAGLEWIATDEILTDPDAEVPPPDDEEALAFLQYTSGSTGDPKGVMVSFAHLRHNAAMMEAAWPGGADHRFVCWLPLYHDMGLIANVLQTVVYGAACTLITPLQFIARPRSWLEALSDACGTISMAPNFAYDLCLRKVGPEELEGLDLADWRVAVNASEPTRPQTMERFLERFRPAGFRARALAPTFGMAEVTVFATSRGTGGGLRTRSVVASELARHRVVPAGGAGSREDAGAPRVLRFASNGRSWLEQELRLVDPLTRRPAAPDTVGELWIRGPHVASGYWQRPEETEATFGACLADTGEGPFLRTGDLAFLDRDGELYIAGRLKDVILYHGSNHHPQDLELTVQEAHGAVRPGCVVAFGVDDGAEEHLVVVAEIHDASPAGAGGRQGVEIAAAIRREIFERHDVPLHTLILIRPKSLHKTSSGKLQRRLTRRAFLDGELEELHRWQSPRAAPGKTGGSLPLATRELRTFLHDWLAQHLGIDRRRLWGATPFADLGLDSTDAVALVRDLGELAGRELTPTLLWQSPTIDALVTHLSASAEARAGAQAGEAENLDELSSEELEEVLAAELSRR